MRIAARGLVDENIRWSVSPRGDRTPINDFVLDEPRGKTCGRVRAPLGHFGQPEQIAAAAPRSAKQLIWLNPALLIAAKLADTCEAPASASLAWR